MIMKNKNSTSKAVLACIAIGWVCWSTGNFCNAQTQPANPSSLSPDLQEVVTLSRQQMGDDVITNYIKSTGKSYKLSADDIIYLKSQGISQGVISALLQTASSGDTPADLNPNPANPPTPSPAPVATPASPAPAPMPAPAVASAPAPSAAPQEIMIPAQEYDGYIFEVKECKAEDRQDRPMSSYGPPHQQLVCKVLVTSQIGNRPPLLIYSYCLGGEYTRVIDDMGNEYRLNGGTLGTERIQPGGYMNGCGFASLALPSNVPVAATLYFAIKDGVGYFPPKAKSLGVLDLVFAEQIPDAGPCQNKLFHIQFKNVPIVGREPAPVQTPAVAVTAAPEPVTAAPPALVPEAAPAQEVNFDYFQAQLAPFGTWVEVPGYGQCWSPSQAIAANPDWRPYYDFGQWVYTDNGWFWQSDYTWGDIPFHYGNWIRDPGYGWLWVPGYTWGPSWVFWRQAEADGCIGWAPLPPGAVFVDGGWMFHGVRVGVDFDFGLGADFFVFVGNDHFHDGFFRMRGHEYGFNVPRERVRAFYGRTVLRDDFRRDEYGRLVNDGIGRDRVERLTNHREVVTHFEERNPVGDRNKLNEQRAEEARNRAPVVVKPGELGHEQPGKPSGQPLATPAPVNKVFRPPTPASNPAIAPSQKQAQAPQQKQSQKKQ